MVSLSLIGFKLLSRQGFYVPGHGDLDLLPTDPKINSDHLWVAGQTGRAITLYDRRSL